MHTIHPEKPEILVGKSNGNSHSIKVGVNCNALFFALFSLSTVLVITLICISHKVKLKQLVPKMVCVNNGT